MSKRREESKGLSRRQFLIGSTMAGAGIAGSALAGCAPTGSSSTGGSSSSTAPNEIFTLDSKIMTQGTWSWSTAPEAIEESEIGETIECDVLVIGNGLAGCCAAIAALEEGAKTIIIEKCPEGTISGRGLDIAAFHTRKQKELVDQGLMEEPDYRHAIRRWTMWAQSRVKEPLLWEWARKSGACFDWLEAMCTPKNLSTYVWDGYYKGPDYTEYPVTHAFYKTGTEEQTFNFTFYADDNTFGNLVLMPVLYEIFLEKGGEIYYDMPSAQLLRNGDGPVTGVIAGEPGGYKKFSAKSTVIATGDYSSDKEMIQCYAPFQNYSTDLYVYMPIGCNTGDLHKQVLWAGGAMQKPEPHASVTHLDFGAMPYCFLHVNGAGYRYMNEDVNTQSKSITKAFQPTKQAYAVYDSLGLAEVKKQVDANIGGGLQWGQLTQPVGLEFNLAAQENVLKGEIEQGLVYKADTLEELASHIGCDSKVLVAEVERYNKLCDAGNDTDFGKRAEILVPVKEPPFYAGNLQACLLTMSGGLRTDVQCRVLDIDDKPIEGLYVCGSAAGDFFGSGDYPTFVAGIGHGRCVTFGRMAGINAAGGDAHDKIPSIDI